MMSLITEDIAKCAAHSDHIMKQ